VEMRDFTICMAVKIYVADLLIMMLCPLVNAYRRFEGTSRPRSLT
jgi:hypothetical protein